MPNKDTHLIPGELALTISQSSFILFCCPLSITYYVFIMHDVMCMCYKTHLKQRQLFSRKKKLLNNFFGTFPKIDSYISFLVAFLLKVILSAHTICIAFGLQGPNLY